MKRFMNSGEVSGRCGHKHYNIEMAARCQAEAMVSAMESSPGDDLSPVESDRSLFVFMSDNGNLYAPTPDETRSYDLLRMEYFRRLGHYQNR